MAYAVKEMADLSGVTVRTLHFYDKVGLLKPAFHGANGYRYYEEKQLLTLQQILFFRELGFELKQIRELLQRGDFDRRVALRSHRKILRERVERTQELIRTIDRTLAHLKGERKMKVKEMFQGFDKDKQAEYEKQLIERFGEEMREGIAVSRKKIEGWNKGDWNRSGREWDQICRELVKFMKERRLPETTEVQEVIRRHYVWLMQFWMPNRESYSGHGQFVVQSELRKAYEAYDPGLPEFLAKGILKFAESELS